MKKVKSKALAPVLFAFCDQVVYRFSKLQDIMGAKLFKSFLLFQGENINKPFLDILLDNIDDIIKKRHLYRGEFN